MPLKKVFHKLFLSILILILIFVNVMVKALNDMPKNDETVPKMITLPICEAEFLKCQTFSKEHELTRQRLHNDIHELYFYLVKNPEVNGKLSPEHQTRIKNQLNTTLANSIKLRIVNNAEEWHRKSLANLARRIQVPLNDTSVTEVPMNGSNLRKNPIYNDDKNGHLIFNESHNGFSPLVPMFKHGYSGENFSMSVCLEEGTDCNEKFVLCYTGQLDGANNVKLKQQYRLANFGGSEIGKQCSHNVKPDDGTQHGIAIHTEEKTNNAHRYTTVHLETSISAHRLTFTLPKDRCFQINYGGPNSLITNIRGASSDSLIAPGPIPDLNNGWFLQDATALYWLYMDLAGFQTGKQLWMSSYGRSVDCRLTVKIFSSTTEITVPTGSTRINDKTVPMSENSAKNITGSSCVVPHECRAFSKEHELARRRLHNDIQELYFYFVKNPEVNGKLSSEHQIRIKDQLITTLANSIKLGRVDNAEEWHRKSLANLTVRIQETLYKHQHPRDCANSRLLICELEDKNCGFGCQMYYLTQCLIAATASNRIMVLRNDGNKWHYSSQGWNSVFEPITSCSYAKEVLIPFSYSSSSSFIFDKLEPWTGLPDQSARIVRLVDKSRRIPSIPQLPLSFPPQFADLLLTHHSNPPAFFLGQFLWYLMRENDRMKSLIAEAESKIPFHKGPIVGLHVRRTDKIQEAKYFQLREYMEWAELWYRVEERRRQVRIVRRVFIATDEPAVINEAKEKYKDYEVYANTETVGRSTYERFNNQQLAGIITDIRTLSKCDFVVCTFSSNVCRRVYQLMQVHGGDMAERVHSLDDIFFFWPQFAHEMVATQNYNSTNKDEIDLEPGDVIQIDRNYWNGFSNGTNTRTQMSGLYPSYMVREKWRIVDFPLFNI